MKILITNINLRKAFDTYNIIKTFINEKDIIITNVNCYVSLKFIYLKKCYILRQKNYNFFEEDLRIILSKFQNEEIIYIPVEEETTLFIYHFVKKNSFNNLKYLLPSYDSFKIARNKKKLTSFCLANEIPSPRIFSKNELINNYKKYFFTPVICKPQIGSGAKGIVIINNINDINKLNDINEKEYVIQELIPNGKDVSGAFFLMNKGKLISAYTHKRIRTFPVDGGVTVFSKVDYNEEIIKTGSELLKKLNWSGLAMVEFLYDPKVEKYKVIEINPRLWGSILLSKFSNANFLESYINILSGKKIASMSLKKDVYIRWFIFDLLNLLSSQISLLNFFKLNKKQTCYINATYASWWSVFWFHFFFIFNRKNFLKLISKWRKK